MFLSVNLVVHSKIRQILFKSILIIGIIFYYLNTKVHSGNKTSTPSPAGFEKFLPFSFLKRVNFPKVLPYLFPTWERCLTDKKGKNIPKISQKLPIFIPELFDSIAPQNAEIRTVTNSLPLNFKNFAKSLFFNRLSQTDENLK